MATSFCFLWKYKQMKRVSLIETPCLLICLFFRNFNNRLAAHVHSKRLGDPDAAVLIEIVLKERDEHSRRSNACVIESVGKICALGSSDPDLETSCLSVA